MNCERIQEFLLTDYIDGELNADEAKYVDQHLAQCPVCLDFIKTVRKAAIEPFLNSEALKPSPAVWDKIHESISEQQKGPDILVNWWENVKSFALPKPAFAFAGALVFLLLAGGITQFKHGEDTVTRDEYWESLTETPIALSFNDGDGFDTTVEQYFL